MTDLAPQKNCHRQRLRKHSFRKLPGGTSGSSTNPETMGRNRRRQRLPPLKAELERIRCNKANRVSSQIRKLKNEPAWQLLSKVDQEAAIQEIRDSQEIRYRKDKKKVQEQYKTQAGRTESRDQGGIDLGGSGQNKHSTACTDYPTALRKDLISPQVIEGGPPPQSNIQMLIAALEQSK